MFNTKTSDLLDLAELGEELESATASSSGPLREGKDGVHSPARLPLQTDNLSPEVQQMRKELLKVVTRLDKRLQKVIEGTRVSIQIRYVFLTSLALVVLVAVVLAIFREAPTLAAIGTLIPGGIIAWVLQNLRGLQNERIHLKFLMGRYEPLIVTCEDVLCLTKVAERMQEAFEMLGSPSK